jgi:hypothetical protein
MTAAEWVMGLWLAVATIGAVLGLALAVPLDG